MDGILVAATAALVGLQAVVARSAAATDEEIGQAFGTLLGWAAGLWRALLVVTLALAVVIVADAVVQRRWLLVRDLFIALLLATAGACVLGRIVDSDWLPLQADPLSHWGFPELRIACVVAVIAVAGPELVRPVRVVAVWLVGLASLGVLALEVAPPVGRSRWTRARSRPLGRSSGSRSGPPLGAPPMSACVGRSSRSGSTSATC